MCDDVATPCEGEAEVVRDACIVLGRWIRSNRYDCWAVCFAALIVVAAIVIR